MPVAALRLLPVMSGLRTWGRFSLIVELAASDAVFLRPQHPYTRVLLSALPSLDPDRHSKRQVLSGEPPTPIHPPPGCPFAPRCPDAQEICGREQPPLVRRSDDPAHLCACHFPRIVPGA
jgi:oligopeptide/dipeptide ABC transporter ATP-binding protein